MPKSIAPEHAAQWITTEWEFGCNYQSGLEHYSTSEATFVSPSYDSLLSPITQKQTLLGLVTT